MTLCLALDESHSYPRYYAGHGMVHFAVAEYRTDEANDDLLSVGTQVSVE